MTHILVYVLKEKEHDLFKRENDDLIYNAKIPLGKALIGCFVELPTLDGRLLSVPINDIGKSVILMTHKIFKLSKPNLNLNSSDYGWIQTLSRERVKRQNLGNLTLNSESVSKIMPACDI